MKYAFTVILAALIATAGNAHASSLADAAKANCVKAIMDCASQVTRGQVAKFQFHGDGAGFEMSGIDENRNMVTCKAGADGRAKWVYGC